MSDSESDTPTQIVPETKQKFRRESLFLGVEDAFTFDFGFSGDAPAPSSSGIGFGADDDGDAADAPAVSQLFGKDQRPPMTFEEVEALVNDSEKLANVISTRPFSNLKGSHFIREAVENHFIDLVETLKRTQERGAPSSSGAPSGAKQAGKTGRHRPNRGADSDSDDADDAEASRPRSRGGRGDRGRGRGGATSRGAGGRGRGRGDGAGRGGGRGEARGRGAPATTPASTTTPSQ